MKNSGIKTISLSLLVMALWGSIFTAVKIGYGALGMDNTLPKELPTEEALRIAEQKLSFIG